jgi:hypothetical protein
VKVGVRPEGLYLIGPRKGLPSRQSSHLDITLITIPEKHEATRLALADRWPHLFLIPVPLKIGIHRDICSERVLSRHKVQHFLFHWVRQPAYLAAVQSASHRYDLAGNMHPVVYRGPR